MATEEQEAEAAKEAAERKQHEAEVEAKAKEHKAKMEERAIEGFEELRQAHEEEEPPSLF